MYVSNDGSNWIPAFYQASLEVGGVTGEVTIAKMREPRTARYVKLVVVDVDGNGINNYVVLDDFLPLLK